MSPPPPAPCRGFLKELDFFLLRTAPRDHPKGPSSANHQPPPTATNRQSPTAQRPPPTANAWCAHGLFWENYVTEKFFFFPPLRTALAPCPSNTRVTLAWGESFSVTVTSLTWMSVIPGASGAGQRATQRAHHKGGAPGRVTAPNPPEGSPHPAPRARTSWATTQTTPTATVTPLLHLLPPSHRTLQRYALGLMPRNFSDGRTGGGWRPPGAGCL